jgi:dolichol kinase
MVAPVRPPRPENWARSASHVVGALIAIGVLRFLPDQRVAVALSACAVMWLLEVTRRRAAALNTVLMRWFGVFAHPHEHAHVNSATWFATGLAVLSFLPVPPAAAAVAVLGFGDPAAGAVGRRWGKTRLAEGRSLEGTLAFALVGALAAHAALSFAWPSEARWTLSLTAAAAGAVTEALLRSVDDNVAVPIVAALAALAVSALG